MLVAGDRAPEWFGDMLNFDLMEISDGHKYTNLWHMAEGKEKQSRAKLSALSTTSNTAIESLERSRAELSLGADMLINRSFRYVTELTNHPKRGPSTIAGLERKVSEFTCKKLPKMNLTYFEYLMVSAEAMSLAGEHGQLNESKERLAALVQTVKRQTSNKELAALDHNDPKRVLTLFKQTVDMYREGATLAGHLVTRVTPEKEGENQSIFPGVFIAAVLVLSLLTSIVTNEGR